MAAIKIIGADKVMKWSNGQIKIIRPQTMFASRREKVIPASSIAGVEIKKPGGFFRGYIQIQTAGQISRNSAGTLTGGTYDAVNDENAVLFEGEENYLAAKAIQKAVADFNSKAGAVEVTSDADELAKFKKLLDDGAITPAEYEKKKAQILKL